MYLPFARLCNFAGSYSLLRFLGRHSLALLLFSFSACSTLPRSDMQDAGPGFWKAEGKLGIRSQTKAQSANFVWENMNRDYLIQLFGPLGQGRVHIEKNGSEVTLTHKGQHSTARSAQELLYLETGIVMPVHWLNSWIKGKPSPESIITDAVYEDEGRLAQFQQSDWLVTYSRYEQNQDQKLPTKMILKHADYTLTIIIKSWGL